MDSGARAYGYQDAVDGLRKEMRAAGFELDSKVDSEMIREALQKGYSNDIFAGYGSCLERIRQMGSVEKIKDVVAEQSTSWPISLLRTYRHLLRFC